MWNTNLRANVARVVYDVWKYQGQPQTIAALDILKHYRQAIGSITPEVLSDALAAMEDDSAPMPFLRVRIENVAGEMGDLGLTKIDPNQLVMLARVT